MRQKIFLHRRKLWMVACGRLDLIGKTMKYIYICNLHFEPHMYRRNKLKLKKNAVPTVLLPSQLQKNHRGLSSESSNQLGVLPTLDFEVKEARKDKPNDKTSEDHAGYFCDNCSKRIVGFRYRCVQCENFDLCRDCEAAMTHPQHYVLRIPRPRPFSEIKSILDAIREKMNVLSGELQENRLELNETKLELNEIKLEPDFVDPAALDPLHDCPATSHVASHSPTSHVATSHVASHSATIATSHDAGTSNTSLKSHEEINNLPQHIATSQFKTHKRPARISGDKNKKLIISQKKDAFQKPQAGPQDGDEKGFKRKKIDDTEETWLDEDILDEDIDFSTEELEEDSEQCPSDSE